MEWDWCYMSISKLTQDKQPIITKDVCILTTTYFESIRFLCFIIMGVVEINVSYKLLEVSIQQLN